MLLDLARGLACLWVFLFHLQSLFATPSPLIASIASFGHLGVPMFFVISGYVITFAAESSRNANRAPLVFLRNRFRRIYLTYWASLLLVLLLPYGLELLSSFKTGQYTLPESLLTRYNPGEWLNIVLLTKVFWANTNDLAHEFAGINTVYWTLAIEFQFYLVVFIALCLGRYYRHAIALVTLVSLLLIIIPNSVNYGLFLHYWPAFSVGILLAYLHRNGIELHINSARNVMLLVVFTAITLAYAAYIHPIQIRTQFLAFASIFGALLWLYSDLELVLQRLKRSNSWLVYILLEPWLVLGAMSYSVYLLHLKLFALPFMFASQLFNADSIGLGLVTILSTLVLTYPFYYFVERRFLSQRYKTLHRSVISVAGTKK
ncbi:MAG: acyltransferase [Halioglobus sp.]|nr:acyltransferase [Halioglobus sp.]